MTTGIYIRMDKYKLKIGRYYRNLYPYIPDLCLCGCGEIVYGGKKFIIGHQNRITENKLKNSNSHKSIIPTEETKNKISNSNSGENNGMFGKIPWNKGVSPTKETRDKISNKLKGRKLSKETIDKMKHNRVGMKNKHHTQETKDKISKILAKPEIKQKQSNSKIGNKNPRFGKPPSYKSNYGKRYYYDSPLQGMVYLRSSYELSYVKYLDEHKISWIYEMKTFDLGDTTYTPDFYLPQTNEYIEIKGYMRKESQEKINKFLKQYSCKLEILYKEDLIKLGCKLCRS